MLLTGSPVRANDAVGWLVDFAGPLEEAVATAWALAAGEDAGIERRPLEEGAVSPVPAEPEDLPEADSPAMEAAREAIMATVRDGCGATLKDALALQAKRAADFLAGDVCRSGAVGAEYAKTMKV
jgi:hypothetical protein